MTVENRFRMESGRACIDIELKTAHQLFDERDPAPFRERDLSADAVDYIVGAAEQIPAQTDLNIVLWIAEAATESLSDATILEAVRGPHAQQRRLLQRILESRLSIVHRPAAAPLLTGDATNRSIEVEMPVESECHGRVRAR
jgi:hypothetical protein